MTNCNVGRWLLVMLAIVGLALVAPVVSAQGIDRAADDTPRDSGTADEWVAWMDGHMTDHMGPRAVEQMESYMGVTVDEMAQDMTDGGHGDGMSGQGHGC